MKVLYNEIIDKLILLESKEKQYTIELEIARSKEKCLHDNVIEIENKQELLKKELLDTYGQLKELIRNNKW